MSEEMNAPQEAVVEPTETEGAEVTGNGNTEDAIQELTIPENWEQPVKEFFTSDVFKGNPSAQKTFFDKFKSLDDGYQKKFRDLSEKEKTFASQQAAFKEQERFLNAYKDFENTIAQEDRSQILSQFGGVPQYMARLYNLDRQFTSDPLGFINGIMRSSGITLDMLQNGVNSPEFQQRQFQNQQAQQLGNMEKRLADMVNQRLEQEAFTQKVLAFQSERDAEGKPLHPHLEKVSDMMDLLMGQNPSMSLQEAYDSACYAVPEVRNLVLQENIERESKAKLAQAELSKAKNAKGITTRPTPAGTSKKKNWQTVLDELIEAQGGDD
jgi:hypothetical protein